MKRSEVNKIIDDALKFAEKHHFPLPPFAYFTPEDWAKCNEEYDEIRDTRLGWDITDFGSGNFDNIGLVMLNMRGGIRCTKPQYYKHYAEKYMVVQENQVTPMHMHHEYIEDLINRGGGELCVQLYNADTDGTRLDTDVMVHKDGRNYQVPAGSIVTLKNGESISFNIHTYHKFWGREGTGSVLLIEIAQATTLVNDSIFYEKCNRFPPVEEDVPATHLLLSEYIFAKKH